MDWFFLAVGIVLFGIGIVGQVRGRAEAKKFHPDDLRARRWVVTVGLIVVGAWLVALSAARLLYLTQVAHR